MEDRETLIAEFRRFRDEPLYFVQSVFGVNPTEQQRRLLEAVARPGARVTVRSGHGTGKTTALAWLALWHPICFEDSRVPCTAPTGHQLQSVLWAEIAKWHSRMPDWFRRQVTVQADQVKVRGAEYSQFAVARTARKENPEALQGFHAENLMFIIDEASGVPDPIFQAAEGALSTPNARVVMTSNPTQTTGYFYDSHNRDRNLWVPLRFSCLDSPLVSPEYMERMATKYGEDHDIYRVRVLGEFPSASFQQLIPRELAEEATRRHLRKDEYDFAAILFGLDVARYGDCKTVLAERQGLRAAIRRWWGKRDTMTVADQTAGEMVVANPQSLLVDVAMGSGVIDRLRQVGWRNVIEVNFGWGSSNPRFANKRMEMWHGVKDWLEAGGVIPPVDELVDDLCGPQYWFTPAGKMILEAKEDMRDRGLPSPDYGDALALTFAVPTPSIIPVASGPESIRPGGRVEAYHPFNRLGRRR